MTIDPPSLTSFTLEPIGFIETPFKEKFGTPRQPALVPSSWGILKLRKELNLSEALEGLENFSHIWLIFIFHQNTNKGIKAKIHPPRMEGQKTGLFATRTPHRPNPIGLSVVKLERIEGGTIYVSGVDLVDGTPILDIKPYLATTDSLSETRSGWTTGRSERTLAVTFDQTAIDDLTLLVPSQENRFMAAIKEILELDPRPGFYRGTPDNPNPYTDIYGFRFDDFNIVYRMNGTDALVTKVQPWSDFRSKEK